MPCSLSSTGSAISRRRFTTEPVLIETLATQPLLSPVPIYDVGQMDPSFDDDVLLMLSFSGGGTRASAFSFGVLQELDRARSASKSASLRLDRKNWCAAPLDAERQLNRSWSRD